jgi:hypothetical protein
VFTPRVVHPPSRRTNPLPAPLPAPTDLCQKHGYEPYPRSYGSSAPRMHRVGTCPSRRREGKGLRLGELPGRGDYRLFADHGKSVHIVAAIHCYVAMLRPISSLGHAAPGAGDLQITIPRLHLRSGPTVLPSPCQLICPLSSARSTHYPTSCRSLSGVVAPAHRDGWYEQTCASSDAHRHTGTPQPNPYPVVSLASSSPALSLSPFTHADTSSANRPVDRR